MISATTRAGTTTYAYDQDNQLVGVTTPDGNDSTYVYDALGYQVSSSQNGQQVNNLIDPFGLGNVVGQYDASNNLIADYTYGHWPDESRGRNRNRGFYYDFNETGNTSDLTGISGNIIDMYNYDPFGVMLFQTGSTPNPISVCGCGMVRPERTFIEMGARNYFPAVWDGL